MKSLKTLKPSFNIQDVIDASKVDDFYDSFYDDHFYEDYLAYF